MTLDSKYYRDSVLGPCIDCFLRIDAVRRDKQECKLDNEVLSNNNYKLTARNEELDKKVWSIGKINIGAFEGIAIGISGSLITILLVTK